MTFHLTPFMRPALTYSPDFGATILELDEQNIESGIYGIFEVKGTRKNWRDARTHWRIAAALFPQFAWYWVERKDDWIFTLASNG